VSPRKPRRLHAALRRDKIVRTALPLFARKGLDGVTTRELAAACGVSEALLYRHFPAKRALFDELHQRFRDRRTLDFSRTGPLPPSTETLVRIVFLFLHEVAVIEASTEAPTMRLLYRSFVDDGKFAQEFFRTSSLRSFQRLFSNCLGRARRSGDVLPTQTSPQNLFWFIQHVASASCLMRLPARPVVRYDGSLEEAVHDMSLFALRGLGLTEAALRKYATRPRFREWVSSGL
jgi:TetR/AcrR family transcriptional regulator, transcriptional repressor of aconitase